MTDGRQTVILYGNCQAEAITAVLLANQAVSGRFRPVYLRSFAVPGQGIAQLEAADLATCAMVLEQHDPRRFPYRDRLPAACATITYPALDFNLPWPFGAVNPFDAPNLPDYPFGRFPYGDRIIIDCLRRGLSADETLDYYFNRWDDYAPDVERLQQLERARSALRDEKCDVTMSDYTLEHFRKRQLYWTSNHLTPELLLELTTRLVDRWLSPSFVREAALGDSFAATFGARGPLGIVDVPIHPRVAAHLGLEWYDANAPLAYYAGRMLTYRTYFEEMVAASIRFVAAA